MSGSTARLQAIEAVTTWHKSHGGLLVHARHFCDAVLPAMLAIRGTVDELEGMVADDLWPLATYQEMLFIT